MHEPQEAAEAASASPVRPVAPVAPVAPREAEEGLEADRARYARRLAGRRDGASPLNRLTELAARLLGAESAQVSLIADAQTVVAGTGAAASSVGGVSPSADSLCTVTVRAAAPVQVTDAVTDERVRRLPPVTSGAVGAYLGVPLHAGGHVVGALCVFDTRPRAWSDHDVETLALLAGPVVSELELSALEADFSNERLAWQLAVDAAGVGAFDWDLVSGELRWDERLLELFGLDHHTFGGTIEAFNAALHPEDRDRVGRALARAVEECGIFQSEYRVVLPDGRHRWIAARGQALRGTDGSAVRLLGAAYDTTAVQEGEARVARVLETMPSAFYRLDPEWRFSYVNAEAQRLLGAVHQDLLGGVVWELFPDALGTDFETSYRRAVETGLPVTFEAYYPPPLDGWYELSAWPSPDGLSVYFHDITERRRTQNELARATERASLVADVTQALTDTLEIDEAVARLAQLVVPTLGDWCVVTLVDGDEPLHRSTSWRRRLRDIGHWHADPCRRELVARYAEVRVSALADASFVARALESAQPVVIAEDAAPAMEAVLEPGEARELARRLDPSSGVVIPLRGRGRTSGLLSVFRDRGHDAFSPEDLATLVDIAGRAGLALDNARLFNEQRELAEGLQRNLLTAPPEPDHLHVVVRYEPAAEAAQIGGDWYDAFLQPSGDTMVVIGDVIGHDTEAAAAMGQVRGLLRGIAVTTGDGPADVLGRVDAAMATLQVETTATAVVARLEQTEAELAQGITRVRWSNAGHPPPLLALPRAAGDDSPVEVELLEADRPDLLLGLLPGTQRSDSERTVPRGATLLLYTDGLVERRGQSIDEGIDLLRAAFAELVAADRDLDGLCDELLLRMQPERPEDDVALVAVRLHPQDRPRPAEAGPRRVPRTVPPYR